MTSTIQRELLIPQPPEQVWRAIADSAMLAEWMYPNDFEPRIGHPFTFQVPPNPKVNFEGLTVRCEVLECEPPHHGAGGSLAFSWSAGEAVENTRVSFRLEPDGNGTRLFFEHSGFDLSVPWGEQAFKGADYGWAKMLKQLATTVAGLGAARTIASMGNNLSRVNASDAFAAFVTRVLVPAKAIRFAELASTKNGQRKILDSLCHEFEPAILEGAIRTKDYSKLWDEPCFLFHSQSSFGAEFATVRDAYDKLAIEDSWLIVLQDASAGIHRPEARWDDEKLIAG